MNEVLFRHLQLITRRHFLLRCSSGLGALWLAQQGVSLSAAQSAPGSVLDAQPLRARAGHFPARAKNVIFIQLAGAPSQLELFDYKPELDRLNGQPCPQEYIEGKRFAFIRGTPALLGHVYPFHKEEKTGWWVSDKIPHLEQHFDKMCMIHSMQTDQFNHAPAQLLALTGNQNLGYASMGAWATYGLGSENENLPGYIVLLSGGRNPDAGKAGWSSGFLPSVYQGVQCRSAGDPVLSLSNPPGVNRELRGAVVDVVKRLNERSHSQSGDPETLTRIAQYEMAFRMQTEASEAMDISREAPEVLKQYAAEPGKESFANNCLLARRLVERGVRFVQLFDWGWDHHTDLAEKFPTKCRETDQPVAALLGDLQQRGLLDETIVIWAGEFGRTPMQENRGGVKPRGVGGRDHHADAFTMWLAGGGFKPGFSYGSTDEIGFTVRENPMLWRDLHATILQQLGLDFQKLTYPFQGLDQKLTGVKPARVVTDLLSSSTSPSGA